MMNHFLKAARKGGISIVGAATQVPSAYSVAFGAGAISGAQSGDLAVLYWFDPDGGATPSSIAGWATVECTSAAENSYGLWVRTLSSSDVSATFAVPDNDGVAILAVFRNATYASYASALLSYGAPNAPTIASVTTSDIVLAFGGAVSTTPLGAPAGYTMLIQDYNYSRTGVCWATGLSGSVNPAAFTGGNSAWRASTVRVSST